MTGPKHLFFQEQALKSYKNSYHPYDPNWTCRACKHSVSRDELFRNGNIKTESIERIKTYLWRNLTYVISGEELWDHGWEPDLETAIYRYSLLYPDDAELKELKQLYSYAVNDPKRLWKFEPSNGTTVIFPDMILYKQGLKKVYLPNGLREIRDYTFSDCVRLTDLFIPDSVTEIGAYAFKDCVSLQTIHLPSNLTKISEGLFQGCRSLQKVFLADTIEVIEDYAFTGCTSMRKPWIPKNVKSIGENAFPAEDWK